MPKPKKERKVMLPPHVVYYKPHGVPMGQLEQVILEIDEYEAVRLADHEGKKHDDAASEMEISRPTFTRLLESAHAKISDALVNGKAIRIEGGSITFVNQRFACQSCRFVWVHEDSSGFPDSCPKCGSPDILDLNFCCGRGRRRGRGGGRCGHGWGGQDT